MRWRPNQSGDMPWWGWLLAPVWVPGIAMLACLFGGMALKRYLIGPSAEWRTWFAWYPVSLPRDREQWPPRLEKAWLERVERRSWSLLSDIEYRTPRPLPLQREEANRE